MNKSPKIKTEQTWFWFWDKKNVFFLTDEKRWNFVSILLVIIVWILVYRHRLRNNCNVLFSIWGPLAAS